MLYYMVIYYKRFMVNVLLLFSCRLTVLLLEVITFSGAVKLVLIFLSLSFSIFYFNFDFPNWIALFEGGGGGGGGDGRRF